MNGSIQFNRFSIVKDTDKEEVTISTAASFLGGEVGHVRVKIENHVRGTVPDNCIWMCPHIINKLIDTFH
jgi:hypothetical protein